MVWMVETETGITWSSPALNMVGTLFVSDITGLICAIETAGRGLKIQALWPKFRGGNQNRGFLAN